VQLRMMPPFPGAGRFGPRGGAGSGGSSPPPPPKEKGQ
jgi:hypothetical protein